MSTQHFELDLISDAPGEPTPTAAAVEAAKRNIPGMPGFRLPSMGWVVVQQSRGSASVRSGSYQVHAVQGLSRTWQVDSGYRCLNPSIGPPHPPTTTLFTHLGSVQGNLVQHIWGNQNIFVPQSWVEHDIIPGGSSTTVTFSDPSSPAKLVETVNACATCGTNAAGQPDPSIFLPKTGVTGTEPDGPDRLSYTQTAATPGYVTNGLIIDLYTGDSPAGTTAAAVTLPTSEPSLAMTILSSLATP